MRRRATALVAATAPSVAAAVVAVTVLGPSEPAGAVEDYPVPADGAFAITGHGYGHGGWYRLPG